MSDSPTTIRFEYIKSSAFRVIHADGVFGGLNPRGGLFLSFYSERFPIPKATVHVLQPSGSLGEELREEREIRRAIVREVEFGVECDLQVAKAILEWLRGKVDELEKATQTKPPKETE